MYKRMNIFLAVLAFLLMMLIIPALSFGAEASGGFSAVYLSGHTHGGDDSREPGVGSSFTFEEGMWGATIFWFNYEHKFDGRGTRIENDYILSPHIRPTWELTQDIHLYPLIGPTYRINEDRWGILLGTGIDLWLTESVAFSPSIWTIRETKGNYNGIGAFIRYRF